MSGATDLAGSGPRSPLLALRGLTKRFGSFTANDAVDLTLEPGEIHAILGENGAGKSTLMKLIYGVLAPDAGSIVWRGEPTAIRNPAHARALGIGMVFQHFSLFETLTVEENIALAIEQKRTGLRQRILDVGEEFGLPVDPDALVISLSMGQRQRVEIIRCLLQDPKLIIMDEPTSVLPPSAIPALFETIRRLASKGSAVLFISHKLEEIRNLCHRATVMRAARVVATVDPTVESAQSLTKLMIGRDIPPPRRTSAQVATSAILGVSGLTTRPEDPFETALTDITLEVRPGEIVGIAGISGNGQRQLAAVLSGETPLHASQKDAIRIGQTTVGDLNSAHRRALGLAFVPEDRSGTGSVPDMDLEQNALLTGHSKGLVRRHIIQRSKLGAFTDQIISQMDVRSRGRHSLGRSLSGGNLQKFIVGRELALGPKVLIAAQPTWGVDVGAAFAIRQKLVDLRDEGVGVLLISDELEELLDISDRLHVLFRGRLSPSIPRREATDTVIGAWMTGEFGGAQVASAEDTFP